MKRISMSEKQLFDLTRKNHGLKAQYSPKMSPNKNRNIKILPNISFDILKRRNKSIETDAYILYIKNQQVNSFYIFSRGPSFTSV